ncbi:hypothetical protein JCM11251_004688 [Rhodosporidiobolus azoricus]
MATTAPPVNPRQAGAPNDKGSKRVFRSISRFLSRGGEKQRPKLPHQSSSDPVPTRGAAATQDEHLDTAMTPARSRSSSRNGSRSRSPSPSSPHHRNGGNICGFSPEEGEPHLGPALLHRRRSGSLSNLSAISGADTDASMFPISPSTRSRPASSIISKRTAGTLDSTSVVSLAPTQAGSTYAKSYASTKPTTLLSVDLGGGANRIAVVPGTGSHFQHSHGQVLSTSVGTGTSSVLAGSPVSTNGPGITFSSLPSPGSPTSPLAPPYAHRNATASTSSYSPHRPAYAHARRPSTTSSSSSLSQDIDRDNLTPGVSPSLNPSAAPDSPSSYSRPHVDDANSLIGAHAPFYTNAHPRNNPHPAQSPPDNASILTLASSSFAPSFIGSTTGWGGQGGGGGGNARSSWTSSAGPSLGFGGLKAWSTKQARSLGGAKGKDSLSIVGGADEDASVRALAGSRRPSEESLGGRSTWSAVVLNNGGKERQLSVSAKEGTDAGEVEGGGEEKEEVGQKVDEEEEEKKQRRRRSSYGGSSLRHVVGVADSPETPSSPLEQKKMEDEKREEGGEDKEEKGKGVADEEHVGVVDDSASPTTATTTQSDPAAPVVALPSTTSTSAVDVPPTTDPAAKAEAKAPEEKRIEEK